jgi:hypothetical protein
MAEGRRSSFAPALRILAENVNILPATGGAVEDLQRPDADEVEDAETRAADGDVQAVGETDLAGDPLTYVSTPPRPRRDCHLFRYFIDGSLRTYFIATGIQQGRTFPIELAQIGSACVFRRDDGTIRTHARRQKIIFLAPKGPDGLSDDVWDAMEKALQGVSDFELRDTSQHDRQGGRRTDPRTHAGGIARRAMHKLEVRIIDSTDKGETRAERQGEGRGQADASLRDGCHKVTWGGRAAHHPNAHSDAGFLDVAHVFRVPAGGRCCCRAQPPCASPRSRSRARTTLFTAPGQAAIPARPGPSVARFMGIAGWP